MKKKQTKKRPTKKMLQKQVQIPDSPENVARALFRTDREAETQSKRVKP
ncbi:MAG: hypothetical protein OYM47_19575 [Gemmatimonadota bacterium]|nr:hypothetical protein [Gemmatimonadota bacterium]